MLDTAIPFEIHITTDSFPIDRQAEFINFCATRTAKPLMIELSQGDFIHQPMYTQVVRANDFEHVLSFATEISKALSQQNFSVKRLKIEIPDVSKLPYALGMFLNQFKTTLQNAGLGMHLFDQLPQPTRNKRKTFEHEPFEPEITHFNQPEIRGEQREKWTIANFFRKLLR